MSSRRGKAQRRLLSQNVVSIEHFGIGIRRLRELRGLSQAELGKRVGIGRTALGDIENGRVQNPGFEVMLRLVEELKVPSMELLLAGAEEFPTRAAGAALPKLQHVDQEAG